MTIGLMKTRKTKLDVLNGKTKFNPEIHEFFYEQSNYKIGALQ